MDLDEGEVLRACVARVHDVVAGSPMPEDHVSKLDMRATNSDCPFDSDPRTCSSAEHDSWSALRGRQDRLARIGASPDDYRLSGLSAPVGPVERPTRRCRGAWIGVRAPRGD